MRDSAMAFLAYLTSDIIFITPHGNMGAGFLPRPTSSWAWVWV